MRTLSLLFLSAVIGGCAHGSSPTMSTATSAPPPPVLADSTIEPALSALNHPVSTRSALAQRHFNNGLTLVYAFNHEQAIRVFEKALADDPNLAMAHWGIALALGPNYNVDVDAQREKQANEHIRQAMALAEKSGANQVEKDYIAALATRYSGADNPDLKQLARNYAKSAGELSRKYPDDLDAATLYADAMMNLRPWHLWTKDYQPEEGTETLVATLEKVLRADPDHLGACHLYIHSVEQSYHPERALDSAARLPGLAPKCGHLVHMPSHIYARTGDYESAVTSNEAAVDADRTFFAEHPEGKGGIYEMMYYSHNMHFLSYAGAWEGNHAEAKQWAAQVYDHVVPHVPHMPMLELFTTVPMQIEVKFRRWDDILASPAPTPDQVKTLPITSAMRHYARGMAYADKGNTERAMEERGRMRTIAQALPPDAPIGMVNKARDVLHIASLTLDARTAASEKQWPQAIKTLREATSAEDALNYMEPPDWLTPTRETLGGVLLRSGDTAGAEQVFRQELDIHPRSARALFGLWQSLSRQPDKAHDAEIIHRQFLAAWQNADTTLSVNDL